MLIENEKEPSGKNKCNFLRKRDETKKKKKKKTLSMNSITFPDRNLTIPTKTRIQWELLKN